MKGKASGLAEEQRKGAGGQRACADAVSEVRGQRQRKAGGEGMQADCPGGPSSPMVMLPADNRDGLLSSPTDPLRAIHLSTVTGSAIWPFLISVVGSVVSPT